LKLAGARVLVTGGAGLVGSTIVDQLVPLGVNEIRVLDLGDHQQVANLDAARGGGPVVFVEGDVRERATVDDVMRGVDVVFHQAAIRITRCAEEPRLAHEVLVDGTFNVAEAAAREQVAKVVVASSASVYGEASEYPTTEDAPPFANRTLYGAAKNFNEALFRSFHEMYGLDYIALRYFNVYGPRMNVHGPHTEVLIRWMERIDSGEPPLIFGDGAQTMDCVYVDDVAAANVLAAQGGATDVVCNVASGTETTLDELAKLLIRVMGAALEPVYGPERTVNAVPRRLGSTHLAHELLGFEAKVPLEEGLRRLVSWWRGVAALEAPGRSHTAVS
jgi:UDP-glucose 4-epimerase